MCAWVSGVCSDSVCTGMWSEERCELAIAYKSLTLTIVAFPHILLAVIVGTSSLRYMCLQLRFQVYRFILSSLLLLVMLMLMLWLLLLLLMMTMMIITVITAALSLRARLNSCGLILFSLSFTVVVAAVTVSPMSLFSSWAQEYM